MGLPLEVPISLASSPALGWWQLAWLRLRRDRVGMLSLSVVLIYLLAGLLIWSGLMAASWEEPIAVSYATPTLWRHSSSPAENSAAAQPYQWPDRVELYGWTDPLGPLIEELHRDTLRHPPPANGVPLYATRPLGADKWGRDVVAKTLQGGATSLEVGLLAALLATALGAILGALAGYFGGWIDELLNWLYGVLTSIPFLLLVFAVAAVLNHKGIATLIMILGLTGWTGVFRLLRAEYLKHRQREYVLAAGAMGASAFRLMFVHILPNTSHVLLVQLSLNTIGFIKSEVILSFLGFGVPVDAVSWGSMLNEAQNELILGIWWQLGAAGFAMALLVTAFSLLTDALRDALDPRLGG